MKVIILAAGQGTRLYPLTKDKPKCLVKLCGKSILDHQLDVLKKCGVNDIHIVGGYLANKLLSYGLNLHINSNFAKTNMVTTFFCASQILSSGSDIIVTYGDIVYEPRVLSSLIKSDAPVSLIVDKFWKKYWESRMDNPLSDAETLKITENNKITEIGKKPKNYREIQGQYTGMIKFRFDYVKKLKNIWEQMDLEKIYDGKNYDNMYMTSFLQHLIDIGWETRAIFTTNGWAEIDCISDLSIADQFWDPNA